MRGSGRMEEMEVFVKVVELDGLAPAARALGFVPSAVSRIIARLETRLGIRLLRRSTRRIALTEEGERFYSRAVAILADMEIAEREAAGASSPTGRVRINSSASYVTHVLRHILPAFLEKYPGIALDIIQTDTVANLISEASDIAVRSGPMENSELIAKPLGETQASAEMRAGMERHGADSRRSAALGGAAGAVAGRLPAANGGSGGGRAGGSAPGYGSAADNRLLSDTGQAGVGQRPDHVPGPTRDSANSGGTSQTGSRRFGAAAAGAAVGAGAALMASGAVAGQTPDDAVATPSSTLAKKNGDEDTGYVPQNTDNRPMHNEAHVQSPDHSPYVGKDGELLSEEAARTAGIGAILSADRVNPSETDRGDNAVAA